MFAIINYHNRQMRRLMRIIVSGGLALIIQPGDTKTFKEPESLY